MAESLSAAGGVAALVVDDHSLNRQINLRILRRLGFERVDMASNGAEAVEMSERTAYRVILMDCRMPVMDGFEATRRIRERERERGGRAAIIAVTADVVDSGPGKCRDAGMDDHVSKPLRMQALEASIERLLLEPRAAVP